MIPAFWITILFTSLGVAVFITLIVLMRRHYTSRYMYHLHIASREKTDEMHEEQWDAIEDKNARQDEDG